MVFPWHLSPYWVSMVTLPFSRGVSLDKEIIQPPHQAQASTKDQLMKKMWGKSGILSIPGEQTLGANDSLMHRPTVPSCNPHFY